MNAISPSDPLPPSFGVLPSPGQCLLLPFVVTAWVWPFLCMLYQTYVRTLFFPYGLREFLDLTQKIHYTCMMVLLVSVFLQIGDDESGATIPAITTIVGGSILYSVAIHLQLLSPS